jgi:hypothetical protein
MQEIQTHTDSPDFEFGPDTGTRTVVLTPNQCDLIGMGLLDLGVSFAEQDDEDEASDDERLQGAAAAAFELLDSHFADLSVDSLEDGGRMPDRMAVLNRYRALRSAKQ